ncbi:hypothetical protein D3C81_569910 [compost metagenome]
MTDTSGSLAGLFPLPVKTRATGQLPLQDHLLLVVVVAFAFTGGIRRFDQPPTGVVAISHQRLFGAPGRRLIVAEVKPLIVDGDQMATLVAQPQTAPGTVVQALDAPGKIALHRQTIAIGVADRAQAPTQKMEKAHRLAGQRDNQFLRFFAEIDRRPRQAVVDRRTRQTRQRKRRAPVFRIDPDDRVAVDLQALGQRMAPAKTQADVEFHGAGAIQTGELEGQQPIQHTVSQGQQFFAGDQRYRAAMGGGAIRGIGAVAVGVFRLNRNIIPMFLPAQPSLGFGFIASNGDRIVHQYIRSSRRTDQQRHRWRRPQLRVPGIDHQRFECARMNAQIRAPRQLRQP